MTMPSLSSPLSTVLALTPDAKQVGDGQWSGRCPAHEDRKASLSISEGSDGKVLLFCHAGCLFSAIVTAYGLEEGDLFPEKNLKGERIIAEYSYTDENGAELFQCVRFEPKDFRQRHRGSSGEWVWNLKDVRRVLYRLPEVLEANVVYVCEGEKDVEAMRSLGLTATCNPMGAGKWKPEFGEVLKEKHVIVVADKDDPGRKHAQEIGKTLPLAKIIEVPKGKDAADWIALGATAEEFRALEETIQPVMLSGWRTKLIWKEDSKGRALALENHIGNAIAFLTHDERWSSCISLNEFSQIIEIVKRPPHEPGGEAWLSRPLTEADLAFISTWLAEYHKLLVSPSIVLQAATAVASRNTFHPVRDYLRSLKWDGTERLSRWLETFTGAAPTTSTSMDYVRSVGRAWMISAVARVYRPGCKADHVLILEGMTGIKKSTVFYTLGQPWFTDQIADLSGKDSNQGVQGVWIIELPELDAMSRHEVGRIKAFLTIMSDRFRPPYGHVVMRYDRQCVFAGTVNHTDYLRDETGNRRFWPVRCADDRIDIHALEDTRDQLWAEAVMAYESGEVWWLEDERMAREEQGNRMTIDAWEEPISAYLAQIPREINFLMRDRPAVTVPELLRILQIPTERQGLPEQRRVVSILKRLRWERKQIRTERGGTEWRYMAPL